jgi:hypothetical protein
MRQKFMGIGRAEPNDYISEHSKVIEMDWRKVCLTAQVFAATRRTPMNLHEPTILIYQPNCQRLFAPSKLSILPNFNTPYDGSWYVRNNGSEGGPPVYFPSVDTPEKLLETLEIAWKSERKGIGPNGWKPVYLKSIE